MMDKVLVEVTVPAAEKVFDIFIPPESRMYEINRLISAVLSELSDGKYIGDDTSVLCDAESGAIFDINMTAVELGIKNGSKLVLI